MLNGEESVRFRSGRTRDEVEQAVDDALSRLGTVAFGSRGDFVVRGPRQQSTWTDVAIDGRVAKGRKETEWVLTVNYTVQPSVTCWVVGVLGFFLCVVGVLVFIIPFNAKTALDRAVRRAVRDARDDAEAPGGGE